MKPFTAILLTTLIALTISSTAYAGVVTSTKDKLKPLDKTKTKDLTDQRSAPVDLLAKLAGQPRQSNWQGKASLLINVTPATGGSGAELVVPGDDAKKLEGSLIETVKAAKPGDLLEITADKENGKMVVSRVSPYTLREGEGEPTSFVFSESSTRKVGGKDVPVVVATRFKKEMVFLVPTVKNADGKMGPSDEITQAISKLSADQLVEIQTTAGGLMPTIKSIRAWEAPKRGTFVKVTRQKVGDKDSPAVEIKDDTGTSQTFLIAAKDTALLARLSALKFNGDIYYHTNTDDNGTWLTDVKPVPAGAPTQPPAAGPDKPEEKIKEKVKNIRLGTE